MARTTSVFSSLYCGTKVVKLHQWQRCPGIWKQIRLAALRHWPWCRCWFHWCCLSSASSSLRWFPCLVLLNFCSYPLYQRVLSLCQQLYLQCMSIGKLQVGNCSAVDADCSSVFIWRICHEELHNSIARSWPYVAVTKSYCSLISNCCLW